MSAWTQRVSLSVWRRELARGLDQPMVSLLGLLLLVRVLTDDLSAPDSRHTGSLNLSGVIAVLFILAAGGLLRRRRNGVLPTVLSVSWLCIWTAIAVSTRGASAETVREGVREVSVVALGVIVFNARGSVTVPAATRLVQLIGFAPAVVAFHQYITFTGMRRSYGTFAHPDTAAMFFAIAVVVSLWLYLDNGRRRFDALFVAIFAGALISTFSIDGLATLVVMLVALAALRPDSVHGKLAPVAIAGLVVVVFFAAPLGAQRIANESSTSVGANGEPDSSLSWRLKKWSMLIPEWERSPVFGQGLGTTTTTVGAPGNVYASKPPHNEYIRYLVETGVVGVITLLGALAILVRGLLRRRRVSGTLDAGTVNAPALALVIVLGCLVDSMADNTLLASPTGYAAVLVIAAVLALPGTELRRAPVPQAA
jgi:O-antigen ligase